jgi:large subunit ribosomal protein L9
MKIILLEDVRNLGKKFDVKEVNDGYARNFLFPNKLAETATATSLKQVAEMKAKSEKKELEMIAHLREVAAKLKETKLEFELKADKSGTLFGSVNKESILKALREHHFVTTERVDIDLKHPIKEAGEYSVEVDFKKGVVVKLGIIVKMIEK